MDEIMEIIRYALDMLCCRWNQSGYVVDKNGEVLVRVKGNVLSDNNYERLGDRYRERFLALIECFGTVQNPQIISSKVTFFPNMIICPLCDNQFYLILGYYIDDSSIEFVNDRDLCEKTPKLCLEDQHKLLNDITHTKKLVERLISSNPPRDYDVDHSVLSTRERQILDLVRAGRTNGEIARELFISENTVKSHLSRLFKKLGVNRRRDLR